MDLKLVILFCAGGLPTNLALQWYWTDVWSLADPKYPLPSRDRLDNKLIPAEQAAYHLMVGLPLAVKLSGRSTSLI